MKTEEVIDTIQSMTDFILNSDCVQKDSECMKQAEDECSEIIKFIQKLHSDRDYYFEKLCAIKDVAVHDPDNYQAIIEVLDVD